MTATTTAAVGTTLALVGAALTALSVTLNVARGCPPRGAVRTVGRAALRVLGPTTRPLRPSWWRDRRRRRRRAGRAPVRLPVPRLDLEPAVHAVLAELRADVARRVRADATAALRGDAARVRWVPTDRDAR